MPELLSPPATLLLWALLGYLLGDRVPWVRDNLDIIFILIVLVSVLPIGIEVLRGLSAKRQAKAYGTDPVAEFIEEHTPEDEHKTPRDTGSTRPDQR